MSDLLCPTLRPPRVHLASTWRHSRDECSQAFPVLFDLPIPCIPCIPWTQTGDQNGGGLGPRLSSSYFRTEIWWLDLHFYLKAFYYNNSLYFVINKVVYIHTLQIMHLPLGLPSPLSSLLPFQKKKLTGTSHKKVSVWAKKQVHIGREPSKTNQTRW